VVRLQGIWARWPDDSIQITSTKPGKPSGLHIGNEVHPRTGHLAGRNDAELRMTFVITAQRSPVGFAAGSAAIVTDDDSSMSQRDYRPAIRSRFSRAAISNTPKKAQPARDPSCAEAGLTIGSP